MLSSIKPFGYFEPVKQERRTSAFLILQKFIKTINHVFVTCINYVGERSMLNICIAGKLLVLLVSLFVFLKKALSWHIIDVFTVFNKTKWIGLFSAKLSQHLNDYLELDQYELNDCAHIITLIELGWHNHEWLHGF